MLLAALALFVVMLGFGIVVPLMSVLVPGASDAAAQFSAVFVGYNVARLASQMPAGVWVDRAGASRVLRVGLALYALSMAGFLVSGGTPWFTGVRVLEGLATGCVTPAVLAIAAAAGPPGELGRRVGTVIGIGSSGMLCGPVLGGALAGVGPRLPIAIGIAAAAAVLIVVLLSPPPPTVTRQPRTLGGELRAIGARLGDARFVGLLLPLGFNKLTFSGLQALLPLWGAEVLGLSVRGVTGLFALTGVLFAALQPIAGGLADRVDPRRLILACAAPLIGLIAVLGLPRSGTGFAVLYGAYVVLTSSIFAATMKHAGRVHGGDAGYGGTYGVVNTVTDLMTIIGPVLLLALFATHRAWLFPVVAAIGLGFEVGFTALAWRRPRPLG